jgi:hypothetical protein
MTRRSAADYVQLRTKGDGECFDELSALELSPFRPHTILVRTVAAAAAAVPPTHCVAPCSHRAHHRASPALALAWECGSDTRLRVTHATIIVRSTVSHMLHGTAREIGACGAG